MDYFLYTKINMVIKVVSQVMIISSSTSIVFPSVFHTLVADINFPGSQARNLGIVLDELFLSISLSLRLVYILAHPVLTPRSKTKIFIMLQGFQFPSPAYFPILPPNTPHPDSHFSSLPHTLE